MILSLAFPALDPVAIQIGPLAVRWYALAYIVSLLVGWHYLRFLANRIEEGPSRRDIDDFLIWATIAVVIGGRLGYALFYHPAYYLENPLEMLFLWRGGMSFHGGLVGMILALVLFARRREVTLLRLSDVVACAVPIGLFFGRIANFINGELYGRPSELPWAMVFPDAGPVPRHPSQLYEAALEGVVLFTLLFALTRLAPVRTRPGVLTGIFLASYAVARVVGEAFREPDAHLGFLIAGSTMGQLLSLPMLICGLGLVLFARRRP